MNRAAVVATVWEGHEIGFWRDRWELPELHVFERVGSTNDVVRRLADDGAAAGTVVLAEKQSAGRGRFGRRWNAPAGTALLVSCLARPRAAAAEVAPGALPLRVGLAAASAIEAVAPVQVALKWPNDLLIRQRKVGGILCEAMSAGDALSVIIGIGINVHQAPADLPADVRNSATSLDAASGVTTSRGALTDALLQRIRPLFTAALQPLDASEIAMFAQRDALAGHPLNVFLAERNDVSAHANTLHGIGFGIASDGALLLRTSERVERITTGTVRLADDRNERPAGVIS